MSKIIDTWSTTTGNGISTDNAKKPIASDPYLEMVMALGYADLRDPRAGVPHFLHTIPSNRELEGPGAFEPTGNN